MKYETTPLKPKRIKRAYVAKMVTKDLDKLSSYRIASYLYKRHEAEVWITAFWVSWAVYFYIKLG